jgi:hypothetical protein
VMGSKRVKVWWLIEPLGWFIAIICYLSSWLFGINGWACDVCFAFSAAHNKYATTQWIHKLTMMDPQHPSSNTFIAFSNVARVP